MKISQKKKTEIADEIKRLVQEYQHGTTTAEEFENILNKFSLFIISPSIKPPTKTKKPLQKSKKLKSTQDLTKEELKPVNGCEWDYDFELTKQQIQNHVGMPLVKYKAQYPVLKKSIDLRTKPGIWKLFQWVFNALPLPKRETYEEKAQLILRWTGMNTLTEVKNRYPEFFQEINNLEKTETLDNFIEQIQKSGKLLPGMLPEDVFENGQRHNFDIEKIKKEFKKLASKYHPDSGGTEEQFQILNKLKEFAIKKEQLSQLSSTYREMYEKEYKK
jgi:hypothetical protein